jgi:hypothetical protein
MIQTVRGLASVKVTAERADGDSQAVEHGGTCLQHTVLQIKQIKQNLRSLVNRYPYSLGPYRGKMSPTKHSDTMDMAKYNEC